MKIIQSELNIKDINGVNEEYIPEDALFFDIETTGFSARTSSLYMIGCAKRKGDYLNIVQYLAEDKKEEPALLSSFFSQNIGVNSYISYNGNQFDIPYLMEKAGKYNIDTDMFMLPSYDIYKELKPYKDFFKLPDMKQKTLERFLGIERNDLYSGGELIKVYEAYLRSHDTEEESMLLLHNYEDVLGMIKLLNIKDYLRPLSGEFLYKSASLEKSTDYYGNEVEELVLIGSIENEVLNQISSCKYGYYISIYDKKIVITSPVKGGKIRVPYKNYKDYVYLISEDMAVLKELATCVDKNNKKRATKENCYGKYALDKDSLNNKELLKEYMLAILQVII
ncbi:MAG: ribonuclease H-like domain-containing protein [Lachnospiraceae bacterium]|nr:ribonuclease H-like domain-containing protein [Lachnospiraceae bacterium]